MILDLPNIRPGSYKYKFLINETSFCDGSLPFEETLDGNTNVFTMWSNQFSPANTETVKINAKVTLPLEVQMVIPWKVQIVGRWSEELQLIDCQVKI